MLAAKSVIESPPDGYTIMFVAPNNAIGQTLYKNLPFNHVRDTTPIAGTMQLTNIMVVPPDSAGEDRRRVHRPRQSQSGQDDASRRPATAPRFTCRASCSR